MSDILKECRDQIDAIDEQFFRGSAFYAKFHLYPL